MNKTYTRDGMSIMNTDCPIIAALQYVCKVLRHADLKVIQLRPVYWRVMDDMPYCLCALDDMPYCHG